MDFFLRPLSEDKTITGGPWSGKNTAPSNDAIMSVLKVSMYVCRKFLMGRVLKNMSALVCSNWVAIIGLLGLQQSCACERIVLYKEFAS